MITILLIHIGNHFPHYLNDCVHQIRIHNPKDSANIVLILNKNSNSILATSLAYEYSIKICYIEDLPNSEHYAEFLEQSKLLLDLKFRQKYSQYILERYFIWEGYLMVTNEESTYFLESDNLLYMDLNKVKPTETLFSQDMAMPFDNVDRGAPSFIFVRRREALNKFNKWIVDCMKNNITDDMLVYGLYRDKFPDLIFPYPLLPSICNDNVKERHNLQNQVVKIEDCAFLCDKRFPMVFDSVVYGQAVSGVDPRNTNATKSIGYINEKALFSINETKFVWKKINNLWIPFVNDLPIVNLHIHSKALYCFLSDRQGLPKGDYNPEELIKKIEQDYTN